MAENFFSAILTNDFIPHGFCIKWSSALLATYAISDTLIFLSYFSISCILVYFINKRNDLSWKLILWLFATFIMACGLTHLLGVIVIWKPWYWLDAILKAITALISLATFFYFCSRISSFLNIPSPEQLLAVNRQLSKEIEQRKTMESMLRVSEERWKFALESGCDGVWDWDLTTGRVYLSPRCMEILGFTEKDKDNNYSDWENTIHPDDYPKLHSELNTHLKGNSSRFCNEHRVKENNGQWRWILTRGLVVNRDANGKPLRMIGTQTDISERKQSQWLQLTKIIEGSPEAMLLVSENGCIQLSNRTADRLFGYSAAGLMGMGVDQLVPIAARGNHQHHREHFIRENQSRPMSASRSLIAVRADQSQFSVEISLTPIDVDNQRSVIVSVMDVSERKRVEHEMHLMGMIYQAIGEAVMIADGQNIILAINEAFTRLTGYSEQEVIGRSTALLKSGIHGPDFYQAMWHSLSQTGHWQGEIWNRRKDGDLYHEWLVINTIFGANGEVERRVAMFSKITEQKQIEQSIWRQANFDPLTNLANRRMFVDRLDQELKKAHREQTWLAVLLLDLDYFKEVNDTMGHKIGDKLLQEAAQRIQKCVRDSDTVSRLGGDEFTVILCDLESQNDVNRVAECITQCLAQPFLIDDEVAYISVSIGITFYPHDGLNSGQLIKNADQAMYCAKHQGRNGYSFFTLEMEQAAQQKLRLNNDLRQAIEKHELTVHYQPIINLNDQSIKKAEALIRWMHPQRGMISPAEFIPIAEETGLIVEIGDWVFQSAITQISKWQKTFSEDFEISINKSPAQLNRKRQKGQDWIICLNEMRLIPKSIVIEITEGLLLDKSCIVHERLLAYQKAGIQVAIDDFGTGYSSLAYLKKFDIDYLKIDQSFVRNLDLNSSELALCEAIIVMAHKLGIKVIAEGIETEEQMRLLMEADCDFGQGYYFSKPIPAESFETFYIDYYNKNNN